MLKTAHLEKLLALVTTAFMFAEGALDYHGH
jgi:hypothetical protein